MALCGSKKLSALLRGTSSKHDVDFYCVICLYSFRTKRKLELHKKVGMSSEDTKILEFYQYRKSDKTPFIIFVDLESLIKKIYGCKNNPEKSSTTKVSEHIPLGFPSMSTILSFKGKENKHVV